MTLTLPTAGTRPTLATLVNSHVQSAGHDGQETGDRPCALDVDLDRLIGALRLERRAAEAVAARLHILALAVGGAYPVSVDAADLGLCDAIDQLRQCDLLRAVLMTDALGSTESPAGDAGHRSFDRQHDEHTHHEHEHTHHEHEHADHEHEHTHHEHEHADREHIHHDHAHHRAVAPTAVFAIAATVDDLTAAVDAIDAARQATHVVLDDGRSGASARRRGALRHLVQHAVPSGLRAALV